MALGFKVSCQEMSAGVVGVLLGAGGADETDEDLQ